MKAYRAVYERDESGAWVVNVPRVPGCHTYGRTIEQARRRIREALRLWVLNADRAVIDDDIKLPTGLRSLIDRARRERSSVEREQAKVQRTTREAVRQLVAKGMSLRDAGELLGISRQRAHQLASGRALPR